MKTTGRLEAVRRYTRKLSYERTRHLETGLGHVRAQKMRSFLTMFGIIWGIASVILLVGVCLGFSKDQS